MDSQKYVRMWVEENLNNHELESTVSNYGPMAAFGLSAEEAVVFAKDFHAEFYMKESELENLAVKGFEFYIHKNGLNLLTKKVNSEIEDMNKAMRRLVGLDLHRLSNEELFREDLDYVIPYGNLMRSYIVTQPIYIANIEKELRRKLASFDDQEEIFSVLTTSKEEFIFSHEGDFFKKSFSELIRHEDAKIDRDILKVSLYETRTKDDRKKLRLIKEKKLSDDIVELGDALAAIGEIRMKMRLVWMPTIYFFELFLIELKSRYHISKNMLRKYDEQELMDLISSGKTVDEKILDNRLKGFAKILKDGEIVTLEGEEAAEFIKSINDVDEDLSEIRGNVASGGIAKGKVVVLSYTRSSDHAEKIRNMSGGDILVSEMTRPNIIMACQKAGAIITDEGGITCHAAIVARELKKPCIIGTKVATQVLHDGDLVEVDADRGIVKILEKDKK
jgi:pyruvate,water dikinase